MRRAVAAFARSGLSRGRRQRIDVRRQCDQVQVSPAVERQFGDSLVLDDGSDGRVLGLQQIGLRGDLDGFAHLSDLKRKIETDGLLDLHFDIVAGRGLKPGVRL